MASIIFVSSWPAAPDERLALQVLVAPGPRPRRRSSAFGLPTPKTMLLAAVAQLAALAVAQLAADLVQRRLLALRHSRQRADDGRDEGGPSGASPRQGFAPHGGQLRSRGSGSHHPCDGGGLRRQGPRTARPRHADRESRAAQAQPPDVVALTVSVHRPPPREEAAGFLQHFGQLVRGLGGFAHGDQGSMTPGPRVGRLPGRPSVRLPPGEYRGLGGTSEPPGRARLLGLRAEEEVPQALGDFHLRPGQLQPGAAPRQHGHPVGVRGQTPRRGRVTSLATMASSPLRCSFSRAFSSTRSVSAANPTSTGRGARPRHPAPRPRPARPACARASGLGAPRHSPSSASAGHVLGPPIAHRRRQRRSSPPPRPAPARLSRHLLRGHHVPTS